jgi:hypothetical protein
MLANKMLGASGACQSRDLVAGLKVARGRSHVRNLLLGNQLPERRQFGIGGKAIKDDDGGSSDKQGCHPIPYHPTTRGEKQHAVLGTKVRVGHEFLGVGHEDIVGTMGNTLGWTHSTRRVQNELRMGKGDSGEFALGGRPIIFRGGIMILMTFTIITIRR